MPVFGPEAGLHRNCDPWTVWFENGEIQAEAGCCKLLQVSMSTLEITAAGCVCVSACMQLCLWIYWKIVRRGQPNTCNAQMTVVCCHKESESFIFQGSISKRLNIFCLLGKSGPKYIFIFLGVQLNPDKVWTQNLIFKPSDDIAPRLRCVFRPVGGEEWSDP